MGKNVAWSDECQFKLLHLGKVKFWHQEHKSLVSTALTAAGGIMVPEIFSWHTLHPLIPTKHCFQHHILPGYCCKPFLSLHYYIVAIKMPTSSRVMHSITELKPFQTDLSNMRMKNQFQWLPQSPHLSLIEHLWLVAGKEIGITDMQPRNLKQLCDVII